MVSCMKMKWNTDERCLSPHKAVKISIEGFNENGEKGARALFLAKKNDGSVEDRYLTNIQKDTCK